jgi:hypothetical protein
MELREFVVFISGPYSGDSDDSINYHIARATILSDEVWKMGMTAICPHLNSGRPEGRYLLPQEEYRKGYKTLLRSSNAVWLTDCDYNLSTGTKDEIKLAHEIDVPVFDTVQKNQLLIYALDYVKNQTKFEAKGYDLLERQYVIPMLGALLKSQVKDKGAASWKTRLTQKECADKIIRHVMAKDSGKFISDHGIPHSVSIMADAMFLAWHELNDNPELKKQIKKKMDEIYG